MIIHAGSGGWFVTPQWRAERLSPLFSSRAEAEAWRAGRVAEIRRSRGEGPRPCLCCQRIFESEGRFNRMCPVCSGRAAALPAQMAG